MKLIFHSGACVVFPDLWTCSAKVLEPPTSFMFATYPKMLAADQKERWPPLMREAGYSQQHDVSPGWTLNSTPYGFSVFGAMRDCDGVTDETSPWRPQSRHRSSRFGAEPISPAIKLSWAVQKTPWRFEIRQTTNNTISDAQSPSVVKTKMEKLLLNVFIYKMTNDTMNSWLNSDSAHNNSSGIFYQM